MKKAGSLVFTWLFRPFPDSSDNPGQRIGGVEEDRTPDLRIANAALSQLSYHPMEVRMLALFRPGDNARVGAGAGAGI